MLNSQSQSITQIVIATNNNGKIKDFSRMFVNNSYNQIKLLTISEVLGADFPEVVEDGHSYLENAQKKAITIGNACKQPTLADDSGLEVIDLDYAPGIYSARFAGDQADDAKNNTKLINELFGDSCKLPDKQKKTYYPAIYKCALYFYDPIVKLHATTFGTCFGFIIEKPRGTYGFAYDPYFLIAPNDLQKCINSTDNATSILQSAASETLVESVTMAEILPEERDRISHRGIAFKQMIRSLFLAPL